MVDVQPTMRTPHVVARLTIAAICASALTFAIGVGTAHACSCADVSLDDYADELVVAFVGTQVDRSVDDMSSEIGAALTFDVDRVFLGEATTPFTVRTAAQDSACGVDLAGAGPVAVTARRFDGELHVGLCERPTVDDLVAAFGPGVEPEPTPPADGSWGSDAAARAVLVVLLAAVIVAGGTVIARRRTA